MLIAAKPSRSRSLSSGSIGRTPTSDPSRSRTLRTCGLCMSPVSSTRLLSRRVAVGTVWIQIVDSGECDVGSARGLLDRRTAARQPVEHADHAHDFATVLTKAFERVHRGAAGRNDVLDDQAAFAVPQQRAPDPTL